MTNDTTETAGEPKPTPPARNSLSLRIAFGVSLAFNVLIVGMIAGGIASGRHMMAPGGINADLGPFARAMSIDDRRGLTRELWERPEIGRVGAQELGRIQQAFINALVAEPFDPAALEKIFSVERQRGVQVMQIGQDALVRRISAMSPQQRLTFARRLSREWSDNDDD